MRLRRTAPARPRVHDSGRYRRRPAPASAASCAARCTRCRPLTVIKGVREHAPGARHHTPERSRRTYTGDRPLTVVVGVRCGAADSTPRSTAERQADPDRSRWQGLLDDPHRPGVEGGWNGLERPSVTHNPQTAGGAAAGRECQVSAEKGLGFAVRDPDVEAGVTRSRGVQGKAAPWVSGYEVLPRPAFAERQARVGDVNVGTPLARRCRCGRPRSDGAGWRCSGCRGRGSRGTGRAEAPGAPDDAHHRDHYSHRHLKSYYGRRKLWRPNAKKLAHARQPFDGHQGST